MKDHAAQTIELYKQIYGLADEDLIQEDGICEKEIILSAFADYHTDRVRAFEIVADRSALVVVDMQVAFVDRASRQWVPQAERIVPHVNRFAVNARRLDVPVIFTSAHFLDPSPTDALLMTAAIAEGNLGGGADGLAISPELWRDDDILIDSKHTYDAFFGTDLDYYLRGLEKDTVLIAGTLTNYCCEATARAAFDRGYHVVLVSDLCASDNPWAHDATLQTIRRGFGRVVDSESIVSEWLTP